nr:helix-turn-helix domain-containing protein [Aeromonas veronii]
MVGETIAGFTRRLRMERAARRLLASPQSDITTLALAAGFSSSQNFAKAFRLHFAMSPSEYRQQQGETGKARLETIPFPLTPMMAWSCTRSPNTRVCCRGQASG